MEVYVTQFDTELQLRWLDTIVNTEIKMALTFFFVCSLPGRCYCSVIRFKEFLVSVVPFSEVVELRVSEKKENQARAILRVSSDTYSAILNLGKGDEPRVIRP